MPQNALVRLIYEAANNPLLWDAFLAEFGQAVHAETVALLTQDKAGQWARTLAAVGIDPAAAKSYEDYYFSRSPWFPRRNLFAGSVETGEQVLSNQELVRTEFYEDFLKPNSWLHGCSLVMSAEESSLSGVYVLRSPRCRAFTSEETGLCWYLAPHLQTAARIHRRIADLEATLDRLLIGEIDTKALASLSLTPAETRVAIALFRGQSVEAYAKEAGISINTAR